MNTNTQVQVQSEASMRAEIDRLKAQLAASREARGGLTLKVSEKGALSVYGMGRFPVTLYKSQWDKLLAQAPAIAEFIQAHGSELKDKQA